MLPLDRPLTSTTLNILDSGGDLLAHDFEGGLSGGGEPA